ncbi:Isoamyl acetate-hydrolyzing esterase 1 -like protein [Halotydeus destructor]|nr:Isoamyl acetate-hydrolyzing esterase 1 -like protein [Halotydeus destructor]
MSWSKVILFGDSLTELSFSHDGQWGSLLGDRLKRVADVVNRGLGGFTSKMCLDVLPELFTSSMSLDDVSCVTILLGSNDGIKDGDSVRVPLSEYKNNLAAILEYFEDRGVARDKVILMAPPKAYPVKYHSFMMDTMPAVYEKLQLTGRIPFVGQTAVYAAACVEVAAALQVDSLDLHELFTRDQRGDALTKDGVHFSPEGSKLVFDHLWPLVEPKVLKHAGTHRLTPNCDYFKLNL